MVVHSRKDIDIMDLQHLSTVMLNLLARLVLILIAWNKDGLIKEEDNILVHSVSPVGGPMHLVDMMTI